MNYKPSHITVNGKPISIAGLIKNSRSELEQELSTFLEEWYSEVDFIEVQTSGSTGEAKTIQLKKDFVAASAHRTINYFQLKTNDRLLHCLPLKYIAGKLMVVRAIIGKLDLHIIEPSSDFKLLENETFEFAAMVPNQVSKLFNLNTQNWNLNKLLIGGDAISTNLEKQLQKIDTACYSSYGMTETATHIALRKLNGKNADKFYHCLNEIRVQLGQDQSLEIFVPGHEEQPLKTTDIAEIKDKKTFKILGRADNIIISGGIKFSPEAIEKKLEAHIQFPFMISAVPHEKLGKQLILLVESGHNEDLLVDLKTVCQKQLDKFEQARQIVFTSNLPRTSNGKLKRN